MEMPNKGIKVTCYTRHFWRRVRCAWLVLWGAPYARRYKSEHWQQGSLVVLWVKLSCYQADLFGLYF